MSSTAEPDAAAVISYSGLPEQDAGERGLARAIGAHQGVELALVDGEIDTPKDLDVAFRSGCVESFDFEQGQADMTESLRLRSPLILRT